jgi:hypothetical protein
MTRDEAKAMMARETPEGREKEIAEIMAECARHNEAISDGPPRGPLRSRRDAELIYSYRHGITVETICMMLTDMEFAATGRRDVERD